MAISNSAVDPKQAHTRADPAPYKLLDADKRLFDPAAAKESHSGVPGPRMDR